jgi:hypothetical protein
MNPDGVREAFYEVVADLPDWHGAPPEPTVLIDREPYSMSEICELVNSEPFAADEMPDDLIEMMLLLGKVDPNHRLIDRTFRGGARFVGEIIRGRRRGFEYKQQMTGQKRDPE